MQSRALIGVLIVAAVVRLIGLDWESYWFDEIWAVNQVRDTLAGVLHSLANQDVHPPLYPVLLWGWVKVGGESEFWTRLLSATFGFGAVIFIYLLGRDLYNRTTGIWAAWLLGLNAFAVFYSQEARSYSLMLCLGIASTWFLVRRQWIIYGALAAMLAYTHNFGLFLLLAHGLFVLIKWPGDRKAMVITGLCVGLVYACWLPSLLGQIARVEEGFWIDPLAWSDLYKWVWYWSGYNIPVAIILIGLCIVGARTGHNKGLLIGLWLLLPVLIPVGLSLVTEPIFHHKYPIVILGAFSLLAAHGLVSLDLPKQKIIGGALVILMLAGIPWTLWRKPSKEQWRELSHAATKAHDSGAILMAEKYNKPYLPYYLRDREIQWISSLEDARSVPSAGKDVLYLMVHPHHTDRENVLNSEWQVVDTLEFHRARGVLYRAEPQRQIK